MADSEINRTLPAITRREENFENGAIEKLPHVIDRRNLLPVAARFLSARIADPNGPRRASGPTPVREMWPRWYARHKQLLEATRFRQKLEAEMLEQAGGFPVAELQIVGSDQPVVVHSFAELNRLAYQVDADQLSRARTELRQRRKQWKKADKHLGYSDAVTLEQELARHLGILGRVMWITRPSCLIEITAKFHCLIVTHDPGLKLEEAPWPELRTMLRDLMRMEERAGETRACRSSLEAS